MADFSLNTLNFSKISAPSAPKMWRFMSRTYGVLCPKESPPLKSGSPPQISLCSIAIFQDNFFYAINLWTIFSRVCFKLVSNAIPFGAKFFLLFFPSYSFFGSLFSKLFYRMYLSQIYFDTYFSGNTLFVGTIFSKQFSGVIFLQLFL